MAWKRWTRRDLLCVAAGGAAAWLSGCGGGGGGTSPKETTRKRVAAQHQKIVTSAQAFGPIYRGNLPSPLAGGGTEDAARPPMVGAFLSNIASAPKSTRAARIASMRRTRQESVPGEPGKPADPPFWEGQSFYFDYYLGLWVQLTDTAAETRYDLYEDQEKTKPAGLIRTAHPADWSVFPQVYRSEYQFTAGLLAGAHGSSENVTHADWSGTSKYENVYADGWKDSGESNWSGQGDSSWKSRNETGTGQWTEYAGTFRRDGSGGMRMSDSEGYGSIYTYNRDGSGRATFSGPSEDLPVSVVWDPYGNATIYYKDGTSEQIEGWWGRWWWGVPVPAVDSGGADGGVVGVVQAAD